ncbi:MAG: hypothetical protein JWM68_5511, partial [Verrucomicrobiales bacterium]|nr:hypothetical protein [Verrucomicrobiales bacterium]
PKYLHQIWRTEDSLPNPYVRAITQTTDGYVWLMTDDCMARFDGFRFEEFDRKTIPERVERWCVGMVEGRDGSLWGSSANRGLTRLKDGKVTRFTTEQGLLHNYVMSVYEDRHTNLWVGTINGLCLYTNGHFIAKTNEPGLPYAAVRTIYEDHSGDVWVGTSKGLARFNDNKFTTITNELVNDAIMCVYEDRRGAFWVGTAGGVTRIMDGKSTHYTTKQRLLHNAVRAICEDDEGTVWIGTQGGVQRFVDGRLRPVTIKTFNDPDFEGISFVYSMFPDREGNIWIGTNLGLSRLQKQKFQTITTDDGLLHNLTTLVFEDSKSNLWIGTYGGGLTQIHSNTVENWTTANGLSDDHILALCEDHEGTIWIGTDIGGLDRYKDGKFTNIRTRDPQSNSIRLIKEDSKTNLWVCSNAGVSRYENGRLIQNTNFPRTMIKALVEDTDSNLWIGWQDGLLHVTPNWTRRHDERAGLSSRAINCIFQDSTGTLWFGSDAGLNVMQDGKFMPCQPPGLTNERILQILEDDYGRIWLGTREGIFCAMQKELVAYVNKTATNVSVTSFGKKDGMRRAQCNGIASPAGWKTRDGRIWFSTLHGVVAFDPKRLQSRQAAPAVMIQGILMDEKALGLENNQSLPPGVGEAEFHFTALSFIAPESVSFKYMLEGFDTQWRDSGTRRIARYTNLRPGSYRFKVLACNADKVWNETAATFAFTLEPHFYESYWFYFSCIAAAILLIVGGHFYRTLSLREREKELVTLVERRTAKLQEIIKTMESFNYSIAHDLRAPLRAIKGFTNALIEDYSSAFDAVGHDYSKRIRHAVDRMDKLIDDLLIFGRITHKEITVTWVDLQTIVTRVEAELGDQIGLRHAKLHVEKPLPQVWANETLLQQIMTNLISNSLKFMESGKNPQISIWTEKTDRRSTKIFVRDNGIGIDAKHHEKIFGVFERLHSNEAYPGTGIGLAIVQKAIERMDGKLGLSSKVGGGTCFWLELFDPVKSPASKVSDKTPLPTKAPAAK